MEKSSFKEIIEKNPIHYFEYKVTTVESVLETTLSYFRQKLVCLLCISTRPRTMNYQEVDEFYWKCKSRNAMMTWRGLQPNGMVIPKLAEKKAGPRRYGRMPFLFMPLYNLPTDASTRESGSFRHK